MAQRENPCRFNDSGMNPEMAQWNISSSLAFGEIRAAAQGNSSRNRDRTKTPIHGHPQPNWSFLVPKHFLKTPTLTDITVLHSKMRSKRK